MFITVLSVDKSAVPMDIKENELNYLKDTVKFSLKSSSQALSPDFSDAKAACSKLLQ